MGYKVEESVEGRSLIVTDRWSGEAEEEIRRGGVDGLVLNYALGFAERSLEFLDHWQVRRLAVIDRSIADLSPVERLGSSLEDLSVQASPDARLDLSSFPQLRSVAATWGLIRGTMSNADGLERATVLEFDEADLHAFRDLVALRQLAIKNAPLLERLSGIGGLPDLAVLDIGLAHRLADISELMSLSSTLVELGFDTCSSIDTLDAVEALTRLRRFGVSDCGRIETLAPVAALTELEVFNAWGSTRVVDNDLSPLVGLSKLREIRMRDRREYRPRVADIASALAA